MLMTHQPPIANDQHQLKSNVLPEENTIGQQSLDRYIRKRSYEQSPILNAMYNSDQQTKQIVQAPLLTPDKNSTLYSNELHRFQSFQNQLRSQNNLLSRRCRRVPFTVFSKNVTFRVAN